MNLNHAFGFLLVGTVFGLLPRFAPGWCLATGVDGSSAREIWLQIMSALQIGLAVGYLARRALSALAAMMEYQPQPGFATAGEGYPAGALVRPALAVRVRGGLLPVPVAAFRGSLLEQSRAA